MSQRISILGMLCIFLTISHLMAFGNKSSIEQTGIEFDHNTIDYFINSGQSGVLTALQGSQGMIGSPHQLCYTLSGNAFKGDFLIINKTAKKLDLQILCLLDYKQVPFNFNQIFSDLQKLVVEPNEKKRIHFSIGSVTTGVHDFILLAMDRIDASTSNEFSPNNLFFHRVELFAGSKRSPKIEAQIADKVTAQEEAIYFIRCERKNEFDWTNHSSIPKFKMPRTTFSLHINNPENEPMNTAILTFLNTHQIDEIGNISVNPRFWKIPPKSLGTIPVAVDTHSFRNGDIFMILCIENPFVHLETSRSQISQIKTRVHIPYRTIVKFN
jgi:hypothetical protein